MRLDARATVLPLIALLVLGALAAGCSRTPGIVKVNNGDSLKNAPEESRQDEKRDAAQIHTQLAAQYMARGDLKTAYDKLKMAIGFDDSYIPAHTLLAILDERLKLPQEAEQQYRRAVDLDPKNGDTNNNLGVFLCKSNRQKEALEHFQRALADPFYKTPAWADTNIAECLLRGNDTAGAEPYLRKALDLDPNYPAALYQMAHLLYMKNDAFHGRAFLQRFEARGASSADALLLGYEIETRLGDADAARSYADRLRDQFPDSEQAQRLNPSSSQ